LRAFNILSWLTKDGGWVKPSIHGERSNRIA